MHDVVPPLVLCYPHPTQLSCRRWPCATPTPPNELREALRAYIAHCIARRPTLLAKHHCVHNRCGTATVLQHLQLHQQLQKAEWQAVDLCQSLAFQPILPRIPASIPKDEHGHTTWTQWALTSRVYMLDFGVHVGMRRQDGPASERRPCGNQEIGLNPPMRPSTMSS
jgi:hypothetical protein